MRTNRLAKYFPILEGEEFDALVEDIKQHGQLEPIITVDDEILDGVNRYRACKKLGIEPKTKPYRGNDPLGYVISTNIRRRHLNQSQKAALAVEMLPEYEKEADERGHGKVGGQNRPPNLAIDSEGKARATSQAARAVGASDRIVRQAKRVKQESPAAFDEVVRGIKSVDAADDELREAHEKKRRAEDKQKYTKSLSAMRADEQRYLTDLLRVVNLISEPPKELTEEGAKKIGEAWRLIALKVQKFMQHLEGSNEIKKLA
jgi:hypothetical protein